MKETLQDIIGWSFPAVAAILIILAATRRSFQGRAWLITHLGILVGTMLGFRIPRLIEKIGSFSFDISKFYDVYGLPLNIIQLAGLCLLFPFLFAVTSPVQGNVMTGTQAGSSGSEQAGLATGDTTSPLYGVHGWLKFLVVMNLYVGPVMFGLRQILTWIGYVILADKHPTIILVGLIDTAVGLYLVVRGIQVARGLRDIRPRAVQNAKALLKLVLAWTFVNIPISFLSGLDAEDLLPGILKGVFAGVIGFAIWYSYFNVSKRVQATYPDWKD